MLMMTHAEGMGKWRTHSRHRRRVEEAHDRCGLGKGGWKLDVARTPSPNLFWAAATGLGKGKVRIKKGYEDFGSGKQII